MFLAKLRKDFLVLDEEDSSQATVLPEQPRYMPNQTCWMHTQLVDYTLRLIKSHNNKLPIILRELKSSLDVVNHSV